MIRTGAASSAVKVTAKFGQDGLEAIRNEFDKNVLVTIVVRLTVRLRKLDRAGSSAFWAIQVFGPMVTAGHFK